MRRKRLTAFAVTPAVLAGMIRGIPAEALGKLVAELPDEDLVVIARSVLELFMLEQRGEPRRTATRRTTAKLAKPARAAGRAEANGHAPDDGPTIAAVYKAILGADGALSRAEVIAKTKLDSNQVGYALSTLKKQGRAFVAGGTTRARWALAQEIADEALEEAASP